ncbi:MAG: hypothetical protein DRR19_23925 [Candidatus Parabeggiatoa sp. nov. 1]|nr:MAG: hypothetical protein DRR19_23925 [Gammaproteobacteria bacterium]
MIDDIHPVKPSNPLTEHDDTQKTNAPETPMPASGTQTPHSSEKEHYQLPESASTMQLVDALLKAPESVIAQVKAGQFRNKLLMLLAISIICHAIYGLIVGSFSGNAQWLAAPLKIVIGATLSALLCYPSLYIFACLSGAKINPSQIFSLLMGGIALTSILLLGFVPVAFIFTFSIQTVFFMGMVHLLVWFISIYFGLRYIALGLVSLEGKKSDLFTIWNVILLLTMLQMTTTLRPILGESDTLLTGEKRFFVVHWYYTLQPESKL